MNVVPLVGLGVTVRGSLRRLAPSGIDIPNTRGAMIGKSKKLTLAREKASGFPPSNARKRSSRTRRESHILKGV